MQNLNVIAIGEGAVSDEVRAFNFASTLDAEENITAKLNYLPISGGQVRVYRDIDLLIFSRPLAPQLLDAYIKQGTKIWIDQDDDFTAIPNSHIAYNNIGRGNMKVLGVHLDSLAMASILTVSTPELAERLAPFNDNIKVIPNGWNDRNHYWGLAALRKPGFVTIGWGGTRTHREDFKLVENVLNSIGEERQDVYFIIAGDPMIYKRLFRIPEKQKLFVPHIPYEFYPTYLASCDILIAPLVDDHFNRAKSDIKLVEAGATGIPWVASPVRPYLEWDKGKSTSGLFATTENEWYRHLMHFIANKQERMYAGSNGRTHAQERKLSVLHETAWMPVLQEVLECNNPDEDTILLRRQQARMELLGVAHGSSNESNQETGETRGEVDTNRGLGGRKRRRKRRK